MSKKTDEILDAEIERLQKDSKELQVIRDTFSLKGLYMDKCERAGYTICLKAGKYGERFGLPKIRRLIEEEHEEKIKGIKDE